MDTSAVQGRLDWIKHRLKQAEDERDEYEAEVRSSG